MKFGHVELFVKDLDISAEFYIDKLDFKLTQRDDRTVWVENNGIEFLLRQGKPLQTNTYQDSNTGIVIYTEDLLKEKSALENKGIKFLGIDGSEKCLTFTDPDGHWFQLVNPTDH